MSKHDGSYGKHVAWDEGREEDEVELPKGMGWMLCSYLDDKCVPIGCEQSHLPFLWELLRVY